MGYTVHLQIPERPQEREPDLAEFDGQPHRGLQLKSKRQSVDLRKPQLHGLLPSQLRRGKLAPDRAAAQERSLGVSADRESGAHLRRVHSGSRRLPELLDSSRAHLVSGQGAGLCALEVFLQVGHLLRQYAVVELVLRTVPGLLRQADKRNLFSPGLERHGRVHGEASQDACDQVRRLFRGGRCGREGQAYF